MPNDSPAPAKPPVLLWGLVILSLVANLILFLWGRAINEKGRELTAYLANSTVGPSPELRENFYLWITNTHGRVHQLWDEARKQGWPMVEPERHQPPPPPPPW
jgi:hypothetical protein